jgi:hypothetical protein
MSSTSSPSAPQKPKLLDRVRLAMRTQHYSPRTEDAYIGWIRRYIVLNRVPAACPESRRKRDRRSVRSPADRLLATAPPPDEIGCNGARHIPARPHVPPAGSGPFPARAYPQNPSPGAGK